jgi:hypothetical protein
VTSSFREIKTRKIGAGRFCLWKLWKNDRRWLDDNVLGRGGRAALGSDLIFQRDKEKQNRRWAVPSLDALEKRPALAG